MADPRVFNSSADALEAMVLLTQKRINDRLAIVKETRKRVQSELQTKAAELYPGEKLTAAKLKSIYKEHFRPDYDKLSKVQLELQTLARGLGGILSTDPQFYEDNFGLFSKINKFDLKGIDLSDEFEKIGAKLGFYGRTEKFKVGHHPTALSTLREALNVRDPKFRKEFLQIMRERGYQIGEDLIQYIDPLAHKEVAEKVNGIFRKFGLRKSDNPLLFDELAQRYAHASWAGGTGGVEVPTFLATELTPDQIAQYGDTVLPTPEAFADVASPYVDIDRTAMNSAKNLDNVIQKLAKQNFATGKDAADALLTEVQKLRVPNVEGLKSDIGSELLKRGKIDILSGATDESLKGTKILNPYKQGTKNQIQDAWMDLYNQNNNIFNFKPSGNGTAVLDATAPDFMAGFNQASADLVGNVDNAVGKLFSNLDNIDVKTKAWLLSQGPEKIAKGFLSDLGFGTAIGTVFDKEQQQRLMDQEYGAFASKAIQDELIGQGVWNFGVKPLWGALPQAFKSAVGTTVSTGAKLATKAAPYALAGSIGGSGIRPEYRPENRWKKAGFPSEQQYNMAVNELNAEGKGDMHVSYHTVDYESYMNRKGKLEKDRFIPSNKDDEDEDIFPTNYESLFSTNLTADPLGVNLNLTTHGD